MGTIRAKTKGADCRWVTIGQGEGPGSGGTPVCIDGDGEITKGPSGTVGNDADDPRDGEKSEPSGSGREAAGEGESWSAEGQKAWEDSLDDAERSAVQQYSDEAYTSIRAFQTGAMDESDPDYERTRQLSEDLNRALKRAPKKEATVYRGLSNLSEEDFSALTGASEIAFDTVSSSSESRRISEDFIGEDKPGKRSVMFEIESKSGVSLSGLSKYPNEKELLLQQGARFEVIGVDETKTLAGTVTRMRLREL